MDKKILIIDEQGFSRICSAILEFEGYSAETITTNIENFASSIYNNKIGLIITSYPYGAFFFEEIKNIKIPIIILSDHINGKLIAILEGFDNSYCMIKPLDYQRFRFLVKQVMSGELTTQEGYMIV